MLPIIIICIALVLRLEQVKGGARVLIRTCCGLGQRLVATWDEFHHSVVYYATDQCWKRPEACIHAEGGHLLWRCLPGTLDATHHDRFFQSHQCHPTTSFFQSHQRLNERNKPSFRLKSFAFHKLVWWHSRVGWITSGLQFVFLWDNINFQKIVWIMLSKMTILNFWR